MTTAVEIWSEFKQFWDASNQTADQLGVHQAFDSWFRRTYPALGDPDFWTPPDFSGLNGVHTAEDPFSGHIPINLNPHPGRPGTSNPVSGGGTYWPNPTSPPRLPSTPQPSLPRGPGAFQIQPYPNILHKKTCVAEYWSKDRALAYYNKVAPKDNISDHEAEILTCIEERGLREGWF